MSSDCVAYQESRFFQPIIVDYLNQNNAMAHLYNRFPNIENFQSQINEKKASFDNLQLKNRSILVDVLNNQYQNINVSATTSHNISQLLYENTFTITTGHQLNLFTGPLYFLYKIITTINLCKTLKQQFPQQHFVPVYWMATEDHDFEEINFFNFKGKKFRWDKTVSGAVGSISTEGLAAFLSTFEKEMGTNIHAKTIKKWFENAYLKHDNLADATRYLANELFGEQGLVILDANEPKLKQIFSPFVKMELLEQISYKKISETCKHFKNYKPQVTPREINLFYLDHQIRERIVADGNNFKVLNTNLSFTKQALLDLLETNPEKFSPNVVLRPMYQEVILPNLCYIGGGGELAYWLELKSTFEAHHVVFPMLLIRNSVVVLSQKQVSKMKKWHVSAHDLFLTKQELLTQKTKELSEFPIDFSQQKKFLEKQFEALYVLAHQTNKSFYGAVKAQEMKQLKGLDNLEKKLLNAQKKQFHSELDRMQALQNEIFPNGSLQERQLNFSEFYIEYGPNFIQKLLDSLNPFQQNFEMISF
ncbi:bacillithiol biosynthesis cysteine-adding enzyme BshC [Flavobacterium branchiophilum NBRC 15030 = ATCC 35035]|uniref:Putative cysteine ligase BshC n=1 Tax=Flavobacterium branchiophilum TaxID=55197 RepID=A0A543FZT2_9FLAO|nr:bacillithiol biosynthesis cysteine-adding enzyme BshC [Flavobacterium branchiophilum]OXA72074.1 bacillithiol biosynthesis cysteine-adding enzyme BshC [Flavobacterium branchiophilum NBRC 15030 = ATCC 35035]TQM39339.1 bacillithiol biosynthesis cysteine-adding enzyme BshC [Flavobacterium branchiophilum]GEM55752.1 putative cysteine ligase BshC [Flavobacterium branchiophilum NBRC 15030 = ATCC 35035]